MHNYLANDRIVTICSIILYPLNLTAIPKKYLCKDLASKIGCKKMNSSKIGKDPLKNHPVYNYFQTQNKSYLLQALS